MTHRAFCDVLGNESGKGGSNFVAVTSSSSSQPTPPLTPSKSSVLSTTANLSIQSSGRSYYYFFSYLGFAHLFHSWSKLCRLLELSSFFNLHLKVVGIGD